jgi:hypothetical protein
MEPFPGEEPPPFLSTWPRVYVAVLILEALAIALVAVFMHWPYR